MKNLVNLNHVSAGFTAVLVGYTSSVAIILQMAVAAGVSDAQTQSWLLVMGLAMGLSSIALSWWYKTPILTAWSTPGAAMLVSTVDEYQIPEIIGAFMMSGLLIFLTGFITPLKRLLEKIPKELATAMLAAILLPFCLASFIAINTSAAIFAVMFSGFLLAKIVMPQYTMSALLVIGLVISLATPTETPLSESALTLAQPDFINPIFDFNALLNLALPLYIITMLSQNLPGLAMLKNYGYQAPVKSIFIGTGAVNLVISPFGGFSLNLAAITAAICMTEDVDTDKKRRYKAVIWAGVFYMLAGLFANAVVALFLAFPPEVTKMLAGLALFSTLLMCLQSSFKESEYKEPALFTCLVTLSGVSIAGINSVLLGLIAGLVYVQVMRLRLSHIAK